MKIYRHLCGSVIACDPAKFKVNSLENGRRNPYTINTDGAGVGVFSSDAARPQGSLAKYQRRQVANACEWLRLHADHGAMIFVCTTSPKWGNLLLKPNISALVHNLTNGYKMKNFVWVREFAKNGAPHFHFVADIPRFDPVKLSLYWSGLFGSTASNSVRLGSKPNKEGRRIFYLSSQRHAWYLGKYLAKGIEGEAKDFFGPRFRISKEAATGSMPKIFTGVWSGSPATATVLTTSGYQTIERPQTFTRKFIAEDGEVFNANQYEWKRHERYNVYFGRTKTKDNARK